jgi:hypothetical protein
MRLLRFLTLALLLIAIVGAALIAAVFLNRDRILKSVLGMVDARSGFQIVSSSSAIDFRVHLVVVLRQARVLADGREIAKAARVEAHVSYHAILFSSGLPLEYLILERPQVSVGSGQVFADAAELPRFDPAMPKAIAGALHQLSSITRKVKIVDGSLSDDRGALLVSRFNLKGYTKKHLRASPWWVDLDFAREANPGAGSQWSGNLRLGEVPQELTPNVAEGRLWARRLSLDGLEILGAAASGMAESEMAIALGRDGSTAGKISLTVKALALRNKATVALGDYAFHAAFGASADRFELTDIALRDLSSGDAASGGAPAQGQAQPQRQRAPMLTGQCRIDAPYGPNPQISLALGGLQADVAALKRFVKSGVFALPAGTIALADRISSGRVVIASLSLASSLAELKSAGTSLRTALSLDATVDRAALAVPETKLPPLRDIAAKVSYLRGVFTLSQGQLRAGNSRLSDFSVRADFAGDFRKAPYEIRAQGDADLNEVYPSIAQTAARLGADLTRWVVGLRGLAGFKFRAKGRLNGLDRLPPPPRDYGGEIAPNNALVTFRKPALAVAVSSGTVTISPDGLQFKQVGLALSPGTVLVNGQIASGRNGLDVRALSVELRDVPAEKWLPMIVPADQAGARGIVRGTVVANVELAQPSNYSVNGSLTIGPGEIQFGFLRSPIVVKLATLTFKGHDASLDMPSSSLEGQALDMKVGILNLQDPSLRIDATVQRLELEALKFIRLPWSPKTPVTFPGTKAAGHIVVRAGNFAALPLSNLSTDFDRNGGAWRVYNLHGVSLGGQVDLEITGRQEDDWIRIKGRVAGMDAASLMMVAGQARPVLLGKIFANSDLWGDTDTDFFHTLAGKLSAVVKDGRVERFTLLSRILGLIDLKNWLSAQVQDPRNTGLPFKLLNASFAGRGGVLYTSDLLLDGPVMDMTGTGSVDLGDGGLAMEVGVLPFQTTSWLLGKIPFVGGDLSKPSSSILAAYFRVHGKLSDPQVTVRPIRSAAEVIKKTLGFPINLIRPNTVK